MVLNRWINTFKNAFGRGIFPHQLSFFLSLPWRKFVLSPQKLADRLALSAASHVLEVGAGSGFYSAEVAGRISEGHLELFDLQPEMLQKARRNLLTKNVINVGYALGDAGRLPFKENSFDVIFLVTVLGEIKEQEAFLNEARRVLKPKGVLSISEHLPDPDFLTSAQVKQLVEKKGFEFSERHGVSWNYTINFTKLK